MPHRWTSHWLLSKVAQGCSNPYRNSSRSVNNNAIPILALPLQCMYTYGSAKKLHGKCQFPHPSLTFACMQVHTHTHTHTPFSSHICMLAGTHTTSSYICMLAGTHTPPIILSHLGTHTHTHTMRIDMHVHMHIHMHTHNAHIHKHTRTHMHTCPRKYLFRGKSVSTMVCDS